MHELDAQRAPGQETIALASRSDAGRVRTENQDAIALLENTSRERLLLVADGMGGHRGGETASKICVQMVERVFREPHGTPEQRLKRGLDLANEEIYSHALANPELRGMGTTVVVVLIGADGRAWLAWVGDSRCYRLRGGALEALTRDHSLMSEWISIGVITAQAAETHPRRHELTRALGQSPDVPIDLVPLELRGGDRLLLCSDGLHGSVSDRTLKPLLARGTPEDAVRVLVDAANAAGGTDNVSVVVIGVPDSHVVAAPPVPAPEPVAIVPTPEPITPPAPVIEPVVESELPRELELIPPPVIAPEIEPMPDLTADIAAELTVAPADATTEPMGISSPEIGFDSNPEFSFADLGAEIADVAPEPPASVVDALEVAPVLAPADAAIVEALATEVPIAEAAAAQEPAEEAFTPLDLLSDATPAQPEPVTEFLRPAEQQIQIPLMTPVRPKRGLDTLSVAAGIAGTLLIVALGFGIWSYTAADHTTPAPMSAHPTPVAIRPPAPEPEPVPVPAPIVAKSAIAKPIVVKPAAAKPVVAKPEIAEPAKKPIEKPVAKLAPTPTPEPTPADTPSLPVKLRDPIEEPATVPAAAGPTIADTASAEPVTAEAVEIPASARGFELPPDVVRFVDDWLRALATHDRASLESLGFADEPSAFAGTSGTRDGFRLVAADIDEERSSAERIYLRMVVSYAFRDASGRFRTQDEQRLILRDTGGRLVFEGRWQQ